MMQEAARLSWRPFSLQHLQNLFVLGEHLLKLLQALVVHISRDLQAVGCQQDAIDHCGADDGQ